MIFLFTLWVGVISDGAPNSAGGVKEIDSEIETDNLETENTDCNGCNQDYTKVHINATNGDWTGCHKMCTCREGFDFNTFFLLIIFIFFKILRTFPIYFKGSVRITSLIKSLNSL